jgi:TolB-like protein/Tfp pilus assembly protein PilF
MTNKQAKSVYWFGPYRLDAGEHLLLRGQQPVLLSPKLFDLLLLLVRNNGHMLHKDELLKQLWPNTFVGEGNLSRHVSTLRKLLGDGRNGARYIKTIPRMGYRFVATVKEALPEIKEARAKVDEASKASAEELCEDGAGAARNSLAVLPLTNASADPDAEYLADGITESIISYLSQFSGLKVMSYSSVAAFKTRDINPQQAGRELGVCTVLSGKLLQLNGGVVIRVELIDVAKGWQLWGKQYYCVPSDILRFQEEISREIAKQSGVKMTAPEKASPAGRFTENGEVYRSYLKGRYFWNKRTTDGFKKAIKHFEHAIELDPHYALAYAGLADCSIMLASFNELPPHEGYQRGKWAALRALEIDETLAEAHCTLALASTNYDWNWSRAEREYERAIELNPDYATAHQWYAKFLDKLGHHEQAMAEIRRAQEIDPLSLVISTITGQLYYLARQYDRAFDQAQEVLEMEPHFGAAHGLLALVYERRGLYEEAIAETDKVLMINRGDTEALAYRGYICAASGRSDEAQRMLRELRKIARRSYVSPFSMTLIYIGLQDYDRSFEWLDRACEDHSESLTYLKVHPVFDSLRPDPRFDELLRCVGF